MRAIKQVARLFSISYVVARHGLFMMVTLVKVIGYLRFLNPRRPSRKTEQDNRLDSLDTIKPLLLKLGQTISSRPEVLEKKIATVLTKVQNKMQSMDNNKAEPNIINPCSEPQLKTNSTISDSIIVSSEQRVTEQEIPTATEQLGQTLKDLLSEMNIAQFTGNKLANQINVLLDKGLEFKNQISDSIQCNISDYLQEELQGFTSRNQLDDFIQDLDELSLNIERLEAHIQQLTSGHEID